jgi:hypothetical protein
VSLAALITVKPGRRPRLIYCVHRSRAQGSNRRKGLTETDYAQLLNAAHQQLGGPIVLVWDNLNTHTSRAMRELIAARLWLTVYQLPPTHPSSTRWRESGRIANGPRPTSPNAISPC